MDRKDNRIPRNFFWTSLTSYPKVPEAARPKVQTEPLYICAPVGCCGIPEHRIPTARVTSHCIFKMHTIHSLDSNGEGPANLWINLDLRS